MTEAAWFEPVIGLEVHVQLGTRTKIFTGASAAFGGEPNAHTDPYTLALPGTLPVLSRAVVDAALKLGLATNSTIRRRCRFARKHYFYPDLPKGYQISQFDEPLCEHGRVEFLSGGARRAVALTRIHLEEDAGKNTHVAGASYSLVDYNRAGVPLVEIVSEPVIGSAAEAADYLRAIRQLVRFLGISDGNMEEGSLRCDANVSVRSRGEEKLGIKTELKNMNSFKHVEAAISYEIARQAGLLERGERVVQETRLWNPDTATSHAMRSKEHAHDYRYFPEPDLPPLVVDDEWVARARDSVGELPLERRARYIEALGLSEYDASLLTAEKPIADYFEEVVSTGADPKLAANWISTELLGRLNRGSLEIEASPISAAALGELLVVLREGTISGKIAKDVFDKMWSGQGTAREIVAREGLVQVTDEGEIRRLCVDVVAAHPREAEGYRAGKANLFGFFVGRVMKASGGRANPQVINRILKELLA